MAYAVERRAAPELRAGTPRRAARRRDRRGRRADRHPARAPARASRARVTAVALDLDGTLGDTRPLWHDWLESVLAGSLDVDPDALPDDRAEAAAGSTRPARRRRLADAAGAVRRGARPRLPAPEREASARRCGGSRPAASRHRRLHGRARAARPGRARPARGRAARRGARGRDGRASRGCSRGSVRTRASSGRPRSSSVQSRMAEMERKALSDRQLEALLERLDTHRRRAARAERPPRAQRRPPAHLAGALAPERVDRGARLCRARPAGAAGAPAPRRVGAPPPAGDMSRGQALP